MAFKETIKAAKVLEAKFQAFCANLYAKEIMVYMNEHRQIIKHFPDGKEVILKDTLTQPSK
jgi:hypothetical protein